MFLFIKNIDAEQNTIRRNAPIDVMSTVARLTGTIRRNILLLLLNESLGYTNIKELNLILELHLPSNVAVEDAFVAIVVELVDGEFVVSGVPEVLSITNQYGFLFCAEYKFNFLTKHLFLSSKVTTLIVNGG